MRRGTGVNPSPKPSRPDIKEKIFFLISGVIIGVPFAVFFESYLDSVIRPLPDLFSSIFSVAVIAPFIEEFAKAYPLLYRHGETERSIFSLGLLTGLGFGIFEFFAYVITLNVPIGARLPGLFFHAATASITSYGIAKKQVVRYYLLAVFLHIAYNFVAFSDLLWYIAGIGTAVIAYLLCWYLYGKTEERIVV